MVGENNYRSRTALD